MKRKKSKIEIAIVLAILLIISGWFYLSHKVAQEVEARGLKNILNEIWEGKGQDDNP